MRRFFQRSANNKTSNIRTVRRLRSRQQDDGLKFESLDPRRLLAVAYDPVTDMINILGTERADVVQISNAMVDGNAVIRVRDNGASHVFPQATMPVAGIHASLLGGDDQITVVRNVNAADYVIWRSLFIDTGTGNDLANLRIDYAGGPEPENHLPFVLDIQGQSGGYLSSVISFNVSGNGTEVVSNVNTGNGDDNLQVKWEVSASDARISQSTQTGAGNDDVQIDMNIAGAAAHVQSQQFAGDGDDRVRLKYNVSGNGTEVVSNVNTGNGKDVLQVKWELSELDGFVSECLQTGAGNDDVQLDMNIAGARAHVQSHLFTGDGDDTIKSGTIVSGPDVEVFSSVYAGAGNDVLQYEMQNTQVSNYSSQIDLGDGFDKAIVYADFRAMGSGAMDFRMSIDGGSGNDDIRTNLRLGQANGTIGVLVRGGDGNDRLRLNTFGNGGDDWTTDLRIDGGAGFDTSWSTPLVIVTNVERRH